MRTSEDPVRRPPTPAKTAMWILMSVASLAVAVLFGGLGLVALLGRHGDAGTWARWSSVGEAFGVMNSLMSALTVAAVVITWLLQYRLLQDQRSELAAQRLVLEQAGVALKRSADVDVRKLHVELIKMAIDNPDLAEVWPRHAETGAGADGQHMYANLLLQHVWLQYTTGIASLEEMVSNLRFLFASPHIRTFWRDTANSRNSVYVDDGSEAQLVKIADGIWREYEAVLACSGEPEAAERASRT